MAQQAQVITGLANAETAAMNNLATVSQRASIASSAAAGAKNLLSGALGLIGGPMGAATIAAGALFYFSQKAQEAKEAALDTESANNRLKESYDGLSESALSNTIKQQKEAAQGGVKNNLDLDEAFKKLKERALTVAQNLEVAKLKQQGQAESAFVLAGLYELLGDKGAEYNQVLIDIANGTITAANAADKGIDLSIETLNKLLEGKKVLQGMFKDQTQTEGINKSLSNSGGGEKARDSWLQFYDEVRKHSRSTLEEIDAEQQRMFQRLEEHNKKGVVSHEEYESAKLAIFCNRQKTKKIELMMKIS